jgi:hypothetical protein
MIISVLANFFVLSIFGQFDYELETHLLKSENRFHAQHLLPRAVDKLTDDHIATIFEAYQADINLSLEDFRREVAREPAGSLLNVMICQQHIVPHLIL